MDSVGALLQQCMPRFAVPLVVGPDVWSRRLCDLLVDARLKCSPVVARVVHLIIGIVGSILSYHTNHTFTILSITIIILATTLTTTRL